MGLRDADLFESNVSNWFSNVSIPPIPDPIHTPTFGAISSVMVKSASLTAILEAANAYCVKRSILRASFLSINSSTLKSFNSAATFAGNSSGFKRVNGPIPDTPATAFSQVVSTLFPNGVTAPRPVTTTRLLLMLASSPSRNYLQLSSPSNCDCTPCKATAKTYHYE